MPATDAFALQQGEVLPVVLGVPVSRELSAVLVHVDPRIEPASGTVRAVLRLQDPGMLIPEGIEVVVRLPGDG